MLVEYLAIFAAFGLSSHAVGQVTSDSYFYGESPAVYPSPNITGSGDWSSAYAKAKASVAQLTLEEKSSLTYGIAANSACSGTIPAISSIGFPGLCLSDAGNGLRGTDFVNGYPSGIHTGASWNKSLAYARGHAMAYEFRTKGVNVALGPVVGPLGRVAEGGRNWEGISNDPYLCGILGAETVEGFQDMGVIASVKHYIANEQETNRVPTTDSDETIAAISSNIDDRAMHEMYLWPFADAVHAGAGNIMCSYNRVNNSYACQNSKMLNGLLKTELGFQGFVVTDWDAQHSGVASTLAGLEMAMPNDQSFWGASMIEAVNNGSVPEWRLDDMATRILATWYKMGQNSGYPTPGIGMPPSYVAAHSAVNAKSSAAKSILLEAAIEGHVLVKNVNNALPLKSPQLVFVAGYDAAAPTGLGIGAWSFDHPLTWPETLTVGGGSGTNNPAYISSPVGALSQRAWEDGTSLYYDVVNDGATASIDPTTDACIVFINGYATEGWDRTALHDDFSDDLVNNVADQCANTIVVIHSAGIYLVDAFVENPHVTAIIMAHLPGQDSGRAIVSLLYGDSNPSGKLPYTIAKNESDYGTLLAPTLPEGDYELFPQSNFSEGLYIDYRAFDQSNISPRFEFGFGLSYTSFEYSNLRIGEVSNSDEYPSGAVLEGGKQDLWDTIVIISATVKNTGSVDGQEVAQLYVGIPDSPVRQLRGFEKVKVGARGSEDVKFQVKRKDLSVWDVVAQDWKLQSGSYDIYVGASSRLLYLNGTLEI